MNRDEIKDALIEQILFSNDDIDTIFDKWMMAFIDEDADLLGAIWSEVMDEMPELN